MGQPNAEQRSSRLSDFLSRSRRWRDWPRQE